MPNTFKKNNYQEARSEYFRKKALSAERILKRHISMMADGRLNGYDYGVQDKASDLGWKASFCKDAERMFSQDHLQDLSTICLCAVRYSLGRMTYMPKLVQDYVVDHINMITTDTIEIMIRDIDEHGGSNHNEKAYGMDFDYRSWMKFKTFLEVRLMDRKAVEKEGIV